MILLAHHQPCSSYFGLLVTFLHWFICITAESAVSLCRVYVIASVPQVQRKRKVSLTFLKLEYSNIVLKCKVHDQLTNICFCKVEEPNRDEELIIPNRLRQQASHRLSCSSKSTSGRNITVIPSRLQSRGAVQSS